MDWNNAASINGVLKHNERCKECKTVVYKMLVKTYNDVEEGYKIAIGSKPNDFIGLSCFPALQEIYDALEQARGYVNFVKAKTLPKCDYYVVSEGFVLEFDESQHFSAQRKLSLLHYPSDLKLGFERHKWIDLCDHIQARDNDPYYRDEQRAWYDSLRDSLPLIKGLKPTVRLYCREMQWCRLNPERIEDANKFEALIKAKLGA